jgi:hypothetical protein
MSLQSRYKKPQPEPNGNHGPLNTLKQAAEKLGVTLWRVRCLVAEKKLKRAPIVARGFMIPQEEIDKYLHRMNEGAFKRASTDIKRERHAWCGYSRRSKHRK